MGLDVDFIAGERAIGRIANALSDTPHGERTEIANKIIAFAEELRPQFKLTPMCGGHDFVLETTLKHGRGRKLFYFITDEGISTHPSMAHIKTCLEGAGFVGYLSIKALALPLAINILKEENLPDYFIKYLEDKITKWQKV